MRRGMPSCFGPGSVSRHRGWRSGLRRSRRFNANAVRIFGEGYRPPKFDAYIQQLPGRTFSVLRLAVTQEGEGPFVANTNDILYFGDGLGETGPSYQNNPITPIQEFRKSVATPTRPPSWSRRLQGNRRIGRSYRNNPSQGHLTPPTVLPTGATSDGRVTWVFRLWISIPRFRKSLCRIPDSATPFPPK